MKKYATVGSNVQGNDFRTIARKMTKNGDTMNHATARNVLHRAMQKVGRVIVNELSVKIDNNGLDKLISDPLFQEGFAEIVQDLYTVESNKNKLETKQ